LRERVLLRGRVFHHQGRPGAFRRYVTDRHHRRNAKPGRAGKKPFPNRRDWAENLVVGCVGTKRCRPRAMDPGSDLVTGTEEDRRWLDQICREHDELMAEARARRSANALLSGRRPRRNGPRPRTSLGREPKRAQKGPTCSETRPQVSFPRPPLRPSGSQIGAGGNAGWMVTSATCGRKYSTH